MVVWNNLMVAFLVLFAGNNTHFSVLPETNPKTYKEIPVLNVNVYMMGREEIDVNVSVLIQENIDYMNDGFQGHVKFVFDQLFMDPSKAYLPDLFAEFKEDHGNKINSLVGPSEIKGGINIYLFDTYCEHGSDRALMGFTPGLRAQQQHYALNSPEFDRIFMAYEGLEDKTTMIHEMGHFLGQHHPWEMTEGNRLSMGLRNESDVSHNHMSYGPHVEKFTTQQLESMRKFALTYRKYLMEKIVYVYRA